MLPKLTDLRHFEADVGIMLIKHRVQVLWSNKWCDDWIASVTFKEGADPAPAGDGPFAVVLSEGELHVEERDAAHDQHQHVGDEEGAWSNTGRYEEHT